MRSVALFEDQLKVLEYLDIEVRPMGGDYIILTFSSSEVRESIFKNDELWFKDWFIEFQRWKESKLIQPSRLIRLSCYGLPLHLWNANSFSASGQRWGNVVQTSDETLKGLSFAVGKVLISTRRMEAINEVIEVECKGKYFKVRVMEEQMLINTILRTECSCSGCRIEDQKMEEEKEQVAETEGPSKPNLEQVDDDVEIVPDKHEEKDTGDGTISKQKNGKLVFLGNIQSSQVQNPLQLAFSAEKEPLRDSMSSCHGISKAWEKKKRRRGEI